MTGLDPQMGAIAVTMPGGTELIIILFIVLLLFGARRLPDLASSLGRAKKEFRKASDEEDGSGDAGSGGDATDGRLPGTEGSGSDGSDGRA
jgi:sec-independent protein translocase protein TatA